MQDSVKHPKQLVFITIGRNVGVMPMLHEQWLRFILDVEELLKTVGLEIGQRPRLTANQWQVGEWDGTREDAATFFAYSTDKYTYHPRMLRDGLSHLARKYGQEAIGFVSVPAEEHPLVEP